MAKAKKKKKPNVILGTKKYKGRHEREVSYTEANKGKVVTTSGFKNYDYCLNPYVGCEFGCKYCYVRFFIKDKKKDGTINKEWGEFVRVRKHVKNSLPKELNDLKNKRLVIGTMTDPYQPSERKHRITRSALEILIKGDLKKVGIFTRSPIVLEDIDLIKQLPGARVHFTITPYPKEVLQQIEPIAIQTEARFATVKKLKDAGIRVHCNIAPVVPFLSDGFTQDFAKKLADIGVDEFFVDPMQAYAPSMTAMQESIDDKQLWNKINELMIDADKYLKWKNKYRDEWFEEWSKHQSRSPDTLAIWSDHVNETWVNMSTGEKMNPELYGDDLELKKKETTGDAPTSRCQNKEQVETGNANKTETDIT